ncbi:hypothetical protein LQM11_003076 [Vibrio parahaemolyticus]|nr:hypothetical protein [Vibrio parahaemolyticus]
MNQQQLLALLLQAANGNNQPQNPLLQLLGGQTSQQPDLMSLLAGGGNQNPLQALLGGTQQPQIDPKTLAALQAMLNGQGGEPSQGGDLLELLKGKTDTSQSDDLRDAIKFNLEFGKFIEDYADCFPNWFDPKEAIEQVEKWAKTDAEKAQALAAATVKAFFKNEDAIELLEERDRNFVNENILKDGIKESQIDRKLAWPMMQRAIHNKSQLSERGAIPSIGKGEETIRKYESIFTRGQVPNDAAAE